MILNTVKHDGPYKLQWLNECGKVIMSKQVLISFLIGKYKDEVLCDVVPMHATHLLLGKPWQFDRKTKYNGFKNRYSLGKDERACKLASLSPRQVYEDELKLKSKSKAEMIIQQCEAMVTMQKYSLKESMPTKWVYKVSIMLVLYSKFFIFLYLM